MTTESLQAVWHAPSRFRADVWHSKGLFRAPPTLGATAQSGCVWTWEQNMGP